MHRRNLDKQLITGTHAELTADTTVYSANFELSPTDTADAGKHKLCDNIHTYAQLSFIEDGGSGGAPSGAAGGALTGTYPNPGLGVHASTHENGGSDELSVAGLSGALADPQPTTPAQIATATAAGIALLTASDLATQKSVLSLPPDTVASIATKGLVYFANVTLGDPPTVNGAAFNQLGGVPVWTRDSLGTYFLTITGAFTANKTFVTLTNANVGGNNDEFQLHQSSLNADTLGITTVKTIDQAPTDFTLAIAVKVEVYP